MRRRPGVGLRGLKPGVGGCRGCLRLSNPPPRVHHLSPGPHPTPSSPLPCTPPPDVANAVLDGVDGILLGQETLRGSYPVEAVQTVVSICKQVGGWGEWGAWGWEGGVAMAGMNISHSPVHSRERQTGGTRGEA